MLECLLYNMTSSLSAKSINVTACEIHISSKFPISKLCYIEGKKITNKTKLVLLIGEIIITR